MERRCHAPNVSGAGVARHKLLDQLSTNERADVGMIKDTVDGSLKVGRLTLSGGLNEENIAAALAGVAPPAVDLNSGVESAPGRKDREKVRRIVALIRSRDEARDGKPIFRKFTQEEGEHE